MWDFIFKIGMWFLERFLKNQSEKERMARSWHEFVENRKLRASATVELKESHDAQLEELERLKKERETQFP